MHVRRGDGTHCLDADSRPGTGLHACRLQCATPPVAAPAVKGLHSCHLARLTTNFLIMAHHGHTLSRAALVSTAFSFFIVGLLNLHLAQR